MRYPGFDNIPKPASWPLWIILLRRRIRIWVRSFLDQAVAPMVDPGGLFQLAAVIVSLYIVFLANGYSGVANEAGKWAAKQTLLYVAPVYLAICAIRALFAVLPYERMQGKWSGGTFIYSTPKLVLSEYVNISGFSFFNFIIPDAEVGGYVQLRVEADGFDSLIPIAVLPAVEDLNILKIALQAFTARKDQFSAVFVNENRNFSLAVTKPNENPTIIRVFLTAFSVG